MNQKQSYSIPFLSSILLATLFVLAIIRFMQQAHIAVDQVISEHIETLIPIFKQIHDTCTIAGFEHPHNYIDFLTVRSFVSSEVGAMHLLYPHEWEGPYLKENLTAQGKVYEIVHAKDGYYIVPGTGVQLASGKIMGKDIVFTDTTDIEALIHTSKELQYMNKPLAARITTSALQAALIAEGFDSDIDD